MSYAIKSCVKINFDFFFPNPYELEPKILKLLNSKAVKILSVGRYKQPLPSFKGFNDKPRHNSTRVHSEELMSLLGVPTEHQGRDYGAGVWVYLKQPHWRVYTQQG